MFFHDKQSGDFMTEKSKKQNRSQIFIPSILIHTSVAIKPTVGSIIFYHWLILIGLFILNQNFRFYPCNLDRNQTGLRRFKPNSRVVLIDEQSNH